MSVIIVGGGMVGVTLALAISSLTHGQVPVALVEAQQPNDRQHPGFDARAIALAQGTCQQLARIGAWSALADCATAIDHVHVSDRGHSGFVNLRAEDYGVPALGHVLELHDAGERLFALLMKAPGVTLHCPAKVVDVVRTAESARVTLDDGQQLAAKLLVAADGSHSALAQSCAIQWQRQDYQQVAIIANITTSELPNGRAFERFTRNGPLALLPMSQGRSSLVWCHAKHDQQQIDSWDDARFLAELQQAFGWRLGKMLQAGKRHSYPLQLLTASRHISHRLALVGNAAQTLHPIAGQGFNLGLRDVMSLAETLAEAAAMGNDLGDYTVLSHYQQRRQQDQQATIGVTDGLIRLFANRYGPLVAGRNLALMAMEQMPTIRDTFARRTLGWVER
ncbi:2-octaprenyl-6-methoxyphenyl hydroxylase [Yersinia pseudotuberculosis]|uniref:2-octaprenyl-6-methoxyphenyl hydroxylase n=1 Tax=Yersinia pseudotuberculosis TaxID=633 RepID=UPI0003499101|nr:2-octaprenyl-6-methoxyphenyl hydroxylase [Yersinia pseudotuberculosis]QES99346.1 2-octaprenyl-6-methoxyphenyl hydroxylase [Yersinia pseudotuberculosis]CFU98313.1 2-octaprenyl-6-methoxyphenyl hydroxylase [Yersinia pseudotuberculosis]CNB41024.1 2-octaprenyl-6-methoxyphenyl hydroxylase [Yersinia pseudotuberculosis]CNC29082.1 2-octaprenyl-6-methoxyphenyl hydroxylase [Yersinia pseudotuberculosis]CRY62399.1 2-octaprenyl-6-methoxyphenyl hydroxylase [Yersinia pseudotuberculosis]